MEHKKKIICNKHSSISLTLLSMPWYPFRYDRQVPLLKGKCKNLHKPGSLHVKCFSKKLLVSDNLAVLSNAIIIIIFFSIWVFFHEHSRFTGQQGKGEGIYLTPRYHFHPLHRHLDISRAITAESSPLHIAGSRTRTGNLWFPSASR